MSNHRAVVAGLATLAAGLTALAPATAHAAPGSTVIHGVAPTRGYHAPVQSDTWSTNGTVRAIVVTDTRTYIGGDFTKVKAPDTGRATDRNHLAAFDNSTGALITDWNPSVNGRVQTMATDGTNVFVGGDFNQANGETHNNLAAFDPNGSLLSGFNANTNAPLWRLRVSGDWLYVGGDFTQLSGGSMANLGRVSTTTGALDTGWNPQVRGGGVRALTADPANNRLIVGGRFTSIGGASRNFLGSVALDSGAVSTFNPPAVCATCGVFDTATDGSSVYVAIAGKGGGRAVAYWIPTSRKRWINAADGDVQAVAYRDDKVYFGGHFGPTFGDQTRHQLAVVNQNDGSLDSFAVTADGHDAPGIWTIKALPGRLILGGGFTHLNGVTGPSRYAEFDGD